MSFKLKCPTCKEEVLWNDNSFRPFCSERCRVVDLGAWASGDYSIPCDEKPSEEESE